MNYKHLLIFSSLFLTALMIFIWLTLPDRQEYKLYKLSPTNETCMGQDVEWTSDSTFIIIGYADTTSYNVNTYQLRKVTP